MIRFASPTITPEEILDDLNQPTQDPGWIVTIFDNDHNTYEQVIMILMVATGCDFEHAYVEAWEVDHYGTCVVHRASESECKDAASIIAQIGMKVEATPDPLA